MMLFFVLALFWVWIAVCVTLIYVHEGRLNRIEHSMEIEQKIRDLQPKDSK